MTLPHTSDRFTRPIQNQNPKQKTMIHTLKDLLISQIRDLYDAEIRNLQMLSKFQSAATDDDLKSAFADHLIETDAQVARLKEACSILGVAPEGETCEATRGLVKEAEDLLAKLVGTAVTNAAIIVSAQRIEHYEIASYGSAATFAETLDETAVADLLKASIAEEKAADAKLKKLATGGLFSAGVNEKAAH